MLGLNLGGAVVAEFENIKEKYRGVIVQLGESLISLMEATDESSFVPKSIEKRGVGVQHIGLELDTVEKLVERNGTRVNRERMKDNNFPKALVGQKTGFWGSASIDGVENGAMDVSADGKERALQKFREYLACD